MLMSAALGGAGAGGGGEGALSAVAVQVPACVKEAAHLFSVPISSQILLF